MTLERIGKIVTGGYGDRVFTGVMVGLLDGETPDKLYEYIKNNQQLLHWASDDDWEAYRRMAKDANIGNITSGDVMKALRKHRLDLLSVIINTPGGESWLDRQVVNIKERLLG